MFGMRISTELAPVSFWRWLAIVVGLFFVLAVLTVLVGSLQLLTGSSLAVFVTVLSGFFVVAVVVMGRRLLDVRNALQGRELELKTLQYLSSVLVGMLELDDALEIVSNCIWEVVPYSAAAYMIYREAEDAFVVRVVVKEGVRQEFIAEVDAEVRRSFATACNPALAAKASAFDKSPLIMGVAAVPTGPATVQSTMAVPVVVDGEVLGVLLLASARPRRYASASERRIVTTLIAVAVVSVRRQRILFQFQQSRTTSLVQSLRDGIIMFDRQGAVTLINAAAAAMTGLRRDQATLTEVYKLFSDLDLEARIHTSLERAEVVHIPQVSLGSSVYEAFVVPVRDLRGRVVGGAVALHDITHMQEVYKMRTDFMNIAAHDLRTPVTAIKGFVQMIRQGDFGPSPQGEIGEALKDVEEGTDRMISLINDFLTVARIEQGRFKIEASDVDVGALVTQVAAEIRVTLGGRPVKLVTDVAPSLPRLHVDGPKIAQALVNVLDNAAKHTERGSISIAARITPEHPDALTIITHNTGNAIPESDMPHLFDQYYKGTSPELAAGRGGGLGLGLYTVKMIVEGHGGKIWAENDPRGGVTFTFTLPLVGPPES